MPTFLSDPTFGVYLVLIAFALIAGVLAARRQDRRNLIILAATVGVVLVVLMIDRLVESPREEAVRRIQAMAQAADAKNPEAFAAHIAEQFVYDGGGQTVTKSRSEIQHSSFWALLRQYNARVAVWDFSRDNARIIDANNIEIGFMAKGEARGQSQEYWVYLRATFTKQPDGQFRLTRFASFHPANHNDPLPIPSFP